MASPIKAMRNFAIDVGGVVEQVEDIHRRDEWSVAIEVEPNE